MTFDGHSNNVTAVGFQRERKWVFSGSEDGAIKIWDIRTPPGFQCNYLNKPRNGTCAAVHTVALHPNQGELISGDEKGVIRVWDLTANKCSYKTFAPPPDSKTSIRSLCIASDASIVCAANNRGSLFVWKLTNKAEKLKLIHKKQAHNTYVLKCLLSPDIKLLATTSADKTVKIWVTGINARGLITHPPSHPAIT